MHLRAALLAGLSLALIVPTAQASASAPAKRGKLRATLTVLPGSTVTASVPEVPLRPAGPAHVARTSPLTGALQAKATQGWTSKWDLLDVPFRGSLALPSLAPDPLCPNTAALQRLEVTAPSELEISSNGRVGWTLVVKGAGAQVFGCAPAGALVGTTTIGLTGRTEIGVLKRVALRGQVSDITLPDGSVAQLSASLLVRINLRHRVLIQTHQLSLCHCPRAKQE